MSDRWVIRIPTCFIANRCFIRMVWENVSICFLFRTYRVVEGIWGRLFAFLGGLGWQG